MRTTRIAHSWRADKLQTGRFYNILVLGPGYDSDLVTQAKKEEHIVGGNTTPEYKNRSIHPVII